MGREAGWFHQENNYGLCLETPIPITPSKGSLNVKNLSFTLARRLSHPFVQQRLPSTYHLSQAIDWAWGTQQYPGKMKSFSTWSFQSSRGDRQVTGKFYQSNECEHRDVRAQEKRPEQLGIDFLHLAASSWDKGGDTFPSRGNSRAKAQKRARCRTLRCFPVLRSRLGEAGGKEPRDLRGQSRKDATGAPMWFPKGAERFLRRDGFHLQATPKAGAGKVPSLLILLDLCPVRKDLAPLV